MAWKDMGTGTKSAVVAIVVILLGLGGYQLTRSPAAPEAGGAKAPGEDAASPAATGEAAKTAAETEAPKADAASTNTATPDTATPDPAKADETAKSETPPAPASTGSFDVVRVDPSGQTVVAGQVAPGAKVRILLDGVEVATAEADATGNFTALFEVPTGGAGRLMTMVATLADGATAEIGGAVAIAQTEAPAAAPSDVATTETTTPEPPTAPTTGTAPETQAPTALAVTDQGAKVLQAPDAGLAGNVTIETITYPTPESVQFGGKGSPGGFVRLYLDNAPLGEAATIGPDGAWNLTQAGIAPGVHTLRVDQVDAAGQVTSRYETPFKRETVEALAAAASGTAPSAEPKVEAGAQAAQSAEPPPATAATEATASGQTATATEAGTAPATDAAPATEAATAKETETASGSGKDATAPTATEAPATETASDTTATVQPKAPVTVTVQPGYTLWGIASKELGSGYLFVQVYDANKDKIRDPDLIYPGQVFTIPAQ